MHLRLRYQPITLKISTSSPKCAEDLQDILC
nr:MAG TPA: hypothetical protein [Caudoviricetes sp.]